MDWTFITFQWVFVEIFLFDFIRKRCSAEREYNGRWEGSGVRIHQSAKESVIFLIRFLIGWRDLGSLKWPFPKHCRRDEMMLNGANICILIMLHTLDYSIMLFSKCERSDYVANIWFSARWSQNEGDRRIPKSDYETLIGISLLWAIARFSFTNIVGF